MTIQPLSAVLRTAIPMVWDESLSYVEFLAAVIAKVNELTTATNEYLNQDVQGFVEAQLAEWETDGTMATLINAEVALSKLDVATFTAFEAQYNLDLVAKKNLVDEADGPMIKLNNGYKSNYIEFEKDGFDVMGSVGALGSYEMNMSYNMDYADNVHRYYDSTKDAMWFTMGDGVVAIQYAPKNYPGNDDIWYNQGSLINWKVDRTGSEFLYGSLFLGQNKPDSASPFCFVESLSDYQHLVLNSRKSQYYNIDSVNISEAQGYFWGMNERDPLDEAGTTLMSLWENGRLGIGTNEPKAKLHVVGLVEYADNAAALAAGLTAGAFYRTVDVLKVVH